MLKRMFVWGAAALSLSVAMTSSLRADDAPEEPQVTVRSRSGGVIRVVGPDGKVQEHRFGTSAPAIDLDKAKLREKLKELQAAAGDAEAVQRISKELLKEAMGGSPESFDLDMGFTNPQAPEFGIGVSLAEEVPAALRKQLKLDDSAGILVQSVAEESPAAKAGLQEYDLILAVDGKPISLAASLVDAVQQAGQEQKSISLAVISAGEHKTIEMTPTTAKDITWIELASELEANDRNDRVDTFDLLWSGQGPHVPMVGLPPGVMVPRVQVNRLRGNEPQQQLIQQQRLEERLDRLEKQLEELAGQLESVNEKK